MKNQKESKMKKEAKKEAVDIAKRNRLAAVPEGKDRNALLKAMSIDNRNDRGEALYELGYCSDGYGTCKSNDGKIAKRWTNEAGKLVIMCEFHAKYSRKMNGTGKPKAAKVTEMKPKAVAPLKEKMRQAAGPKEPRPKASHDIGEATAYARKHKVPYSKAVEMIKAGATA
jgi:hypothetical protein